MYPEGLDVYDVIIQYTLSGEDPTLRNLGREGEGSRSERLDGEDMNPTEGENSVIDKRQNSELTAAAVALAPNSVDTGHKIIKLRLEILADSFGFGLFEGVDFEEIDMQAARIIYGLKDLTCTFRRAGFEDEMEPPKLTFGQTLEFPWDAIDVPVSGVDCSTTDIEIESELV